jgi:polar amino acid transport system substrate-binding protein
MRSTFRFAAVLALTGAVLAACSGGATPTPAPTVAPTLAPSVAPSTAPSEVPTATPNACAPGNLTTLAGGTLTIGTDNPAYPPYFEPSDPVTPPWELGDPTNGQGFEGAVAYAMAEKLGFPKDKVSWVVVPFNNSFAPGPKTFDFYLAQVSWGIQRAQGADLSRGYYSVNQSVVAMKGSTLEGAKTIAELATYKFGAMVGTTSYQTIVDTIKPTQEPSVYDTNDAAIEALKNKQIDGIVVDLPTAFYVTAAQIVTKDFKPLASIVGQFAAPPEGEFFSLVLAKGSPLTACVNEALAALKADGSLEAITKEWLSDKANAPVFTP